MKNTRIIVGMLLAGAGAFFFLSLRSPSARAMQYTNMSQALDEARSAGKPVILNFGGPW